VSVVESVRRRMAGEFVIDPWGLDAALYTSIAPLARLRWSVDVRGAELPAHGPALLVVARRFGVSELPVLALGVHDAVGRVVRPVGVPDVALVAGPLRRLGAALAHPVEIAALLRAGELVALPLGRQPLHADLPGALSSDLVAPALATGAPVYAVVVRGNELGRHRDVVVAGPLVVPAAGTMPERAVELAEAARAAVSALHAG